MVIVYFFFIKEVTKVAFFKNIAKIFSNYQDSKK